MCYSKVEIIKNMNIKNYNMHQFKYALIMFADCLILAIHKGEEIPAWVSCVNLPVESTTCSAVYQLDNVTMLDRSHWVFHHQTVPATHDGQWSSTDGQHFN